MQIKYNDIEIIRQINTVLVLNVLRKSDRPLSRPNIADELGLSKVTIAHVIQDLNYLGFTTGAGLGSVDRRGGRKPGLVSLDRERKRVMGGYLANGQGELVLSDISGRELKRVQVQLAPKDGPEVLAAMSSELLEQTDTPRSSVLGLVGALGFKTYRREDPAGTGLEVDQPSPLTEELSQAIGIPVWLVDLSRARAFGECWFHHGFQSPAHFFYLNLSHNIGCLAAREGILDKALGEFSSCAMSFVPQRGDGEGRPTVAAALSVQKFLARASELVGRELNGPEVIRLAEEGDKRVIDHFSEFGYNLGCSLSLVVNIDGFKKIILGGFMAKAWPFFQAAMHQGLDRHLAKNYRNCAVEVKPLHSDLESGLMGAQALALDRWVYHTELFYGVRA